MCRALGKADGQQSNSLPFAPALGLFLKVQGKVQALSGTVDSPTGLCGTLGLTLRGPGLHS